MSIERQLSPAEEFITNSRDPITQRIRKGADEVLGLCRIALVQRVEERPPNEDCHQYVFGQPGSVEVYQTMFQTHREIDIFNEPREPGDKIMYQDDEGVVHIGIISDNGKDVRSKWGPDGHVYSHAPFMVPHEFGNNIRIFRPGRSS